MTLDANNSTELDLDEDEDDDESEDVRSLLARMVVFLGNVQHTGIIFRPVYCRT